MNRRFVRSLLLAALLVLLCTQVFAAQETLAVLRCAAARPGAGLYDPHGGHRRKYPYAERRSESGRACEFRPLCKNRLLFDLL